jgi:hypothetical protein
MRILSRLAVTAVMASALTVPFAGTSNAQEIPPLDGCVTTWLNSGRPGPYYIDLNAFVYYTIHPEPPGYYINPLTPANLALLIAGDYAGSIIGLVQCIV